MKILIILAAALLLFAAFVRYMERHSVFFPTHEIPVTPDFVNLPYEDIHFRTPDGFILNGWFIKAPGRATLLYFHGNAGNIGHRLEKIMMFHQMGLNVFIIDYRGYGKSQGTPTEHGIYADALAAYDYLITRADIDKNKIISYGDSLGGAAAVDLAAKRQLACLIADSSFSSAADISKTIFPFVPAFLLATKMDSEVKVKSITIPKLFIHSVNDEIIPFKLGKKLYDAAAQPKVFLQITGGHNTNHIDSRDILLKGITKFLKDLDLI